jgi:hypothetical protein
MLNGTPRNDPRGDLVAIAAATLVILISLLLQGCDLGASSPSEEPEVAPTWPDASPATPVDAVASPVLSPSPFGADAVPTRSPASAPYPPLVRPEQLLAGEPTEQLRYPCQTGLDCGSALGRAPECQAWLCGPGGTCSLLAATVLEVCDGEDNDCDGEIDEATCQDIGPCVDGACLGADGCVYTLAEDGLACDDGDPLTAGDHCEQGACIGDVAEGEAP